MKVDSKQSRRVANGFDIDQSYAQNSSYHEDSIIKDQTTVRSNYSKGGSPEKNYRHLQNIIDPEVIDSVLEPIDGIEDLIKDTPEQIEIKHQLIKYKPKESYRNRAKLREVMSNTKPALLDTAVSHLKSDQL